MEETDNTGEETQEQKMGGGASNFKPWRKSENEMKKKITKPKKENKQVIEIHIYVHQESKPNGGMGGGGGGVIKEYYQCTCIEKKRNTGGASAPCPVHSNGTNPVWFNYC